MYYILEEITATSKKIVAVSEYLEDIKDMMREELHYLNEDILDNKENVQEIVTKDMVIYAYNNIFYCYRIVEMK